MSLTVGTNSWATVAEADTYLEDRWNASGWSDRTTTEKEQLLVTAYRWIQAQPQFSISASSTEDYVKNAQIALAWWIYNYFDEYEERRALYDSGVRNFTLSRWEEELDKARFPGNISDLLDDALSGAGNYFPTMSREFNEN
jgi:hypothetical protein